MDGLQTWVINLDRAPERMAGIGARLQALGLPYTRLPAVDARALTPEQHAALDEAAYCRQHGMTPLLGELGCYLSHIEVMRAFLASKGQFALVLEDDVGLSPALPAVLQGLMQHPAHWDVVKLSAVHRGTPQPVLALPEGHQLAVMLSRVTGSSAYLMNRRAAEAWLGLRDPAVSLLPMQLPYDHAYDRAWRFGLKQRLVVPQPCLHDAEAPSTIGATSANNGQRKFPWFKRLSTYRYRLGNEVRRLVYGLSETRSAKSGKHLGIPSPR